MTLNKISNILKKLVKLLWIHYIYIYRYVYVFVYMWILYIFVYAIDGDIYKMSNNNCIYVKIKSLYLLEYVF